MSDTKNIEMPDIIINEGVNIDEPLIKAQKSKYNFLYEGSFGSSMFNLCSATLGAGALSLPKGISNSGYAIGIIFLILGYITTVSTINFLIKARSITGYKSYEELTDKLYGRVLGVCVEIGIIVFCFGTCISYTIAVGDILEPVTKYLNEHAGSFFTRNSMTVIFWFLFILPLSLLKKINYLRFTSFFGVFMILYLMVLVVVYSCSHSFISHISEAKPVVKSFSLIKTVPIILFTFSCQVNVPQIHNELEDPSDHKMRKVNYFGIGIPLVVYFFIGIFGYIAFPNDTPGNILKGFLKGDGLVFTILEAISFVGMACSVNMAFPLNILPMRFSILSLIQGSEKTDEEYRNPTLIANIKHYSLSFFLCLSSLIIALLVTQIYVVFGVVGGTASAFACFMIPALFIIKLRHTHPDQISRYEYIMAWVIFVSCTILGIWGTIVSIMEA